MTGQSYVTTAVSGYVPFSGQFTGKERDGESGLDYFGARYLSAAQGRFTSADPKLFPDATFDPQSWNKYAYVRNNPLRLVDPNGEDWKDVASGFMNAFNTNQVLGIGRTEGGNNDFRTGQAFGDAASSIQGVAEMLLGSGGEGAGLALDATGVGALAGVPLNIASAGVFVHGAAVAGTGLKNLTGAALEPQNGTTVERRANDFTSGEKKKIDVRNADQNGGANKCESCGRQVEKIQNKPGVPTPPNQLQRHHKKPAAKGGPGKADNGKVVCPECHVEEHRKLRQLGQK